MLNQSQIVGNQPSARRVPTERRVIDEPDDGRGRSLEKVSPFNSSETDKGSESCLFFPPNAFHGYRSQE